MEETLTIYGRKPIEEQLKREPRRIETIYVKDSVPTAPLQDILSMASENRIPVRKVPGRKLSDMVGAVNDQGVIATLSAVEYDEFEDWLPTVDIRTNPIVMVLDELEDVANFGAILRTAAAAGIAGVIVPKHRQAPVNAVVYKTSAGTVGKVPIIRVTNINLTLRELKEAGFWVCALDQSAPQPAWKQDLISPLVIVVGSEGDGIRQKTLELCDFKVNFPMENQVESLNASVSAALLCYEALRQRHIRQ